MSVETLILKSTVIRPEGERINTFKIKKISNDHCNIWLDSCDKWVKIKLDRNQAHLLKLWLEDHLK